jgi:hypothetical protein
MKTPPPPFPTETGLPYQQASHLTELDPQQQWLIKDLWTEQAVGILGGEPKCCKTFLALDMAVSVASGKPCLRQYPVGRKGPVLIFPAEDALSVVRQRLEGICNAAGTHLNTLPLYVITAPRLLLDEPQDRQRLRQTIAAINPILLILDPFIRLHRADENASKEVAPLLGYLRELQRDFNLAVLLVHHVRKRAGKERPGQALRGSSDLHGWGDSNLYLRRDHQNLTLAIEHRAAPSADDITLDLHTNQTALALRVLNTPTQPPPPKAAPPTERILQALRNTNEPMSVQQLRTHCQIRTTTLCDTLKQLCNQGIIIYEPKGYTLPAEQPKKAVSLPAPPIESTGNGNGKRPPITPNQTHQLTLFTGETQAGTAGTQPAQG